MEIKYTDLKESRHAYTEKMNVEYNVMSKYYDAFMTVFPLWKKWICSILPYIEGEKVLEVSFGTGYLMKKYAKHFNVYGIEYNENMIKVAKKKCKGLVEEKNIIQGNVEKLPYKTNMFDTVINTMAFTGYPDGNLALDEMLRVLKPSGKLLMVDFDYPKNRNKLGCGVVKYIEKQGDIIKDIEGILKKRKLEYVEEEIGGFGSVKRFIIKK